MNPTKALGFFLLKGGVCLEKKKEFTFQKNKFALFQVTQLSLVMMSSLFPAYGAQDLHVNLEIQNSWVKNELN